MPKLHSLELNKLRLDDKFFSIMTDLAPKSQVNVYRTSDRSRVGATSSVASFLVLGGQDPEMYRQKKYMYLYSERLRNIYFHDSKYICIVIYNAVSFNYLLYGAINDIILTKH